MRSTLFQIIYKFGPKFGIYLDLANFNTNFIWKSRSLTQLKSKIIFLKLFCLEIIFLQFLRLCLCLQSLRHFEFEKNWNHFPSLGTKRFFVGGGFGTFFMDPHASCNPPLISVLHEAWGLRSNPTFGKIKWATPILSTEIEAATP